MAGPARADAHCPRHRGIHGHVEPRLPAAQLHGRAGDRLTIPQEVDESEAIDIGVEIDGQGLPRPSQSSIGHCHQRAGLGGRERQPEGAVAAPIVGRAQAQINTAVRGHRSCPQLSHPVGARGQGNRAATERAAQTSGSGQTEVIEHEHLDDAIAAWNEDAALGDSEQAEGPSQQRGAHGASALLEVRSLEPGAHVEGASIAARWGGKPGRCPSLRVARSGLPQPLGRAAQAGGQLGRSANGGGARRQASHRGNPNRVPRRRGRRLHA